MTVERARVVDVRGHELSPCPAGRARELVAARRAAVVAENPLTIQLPYEAGRPARAPQATRSPVVPGTPLLLHICCGPCATYPVPHLRELGFEVTGWWYNPNVQPADEYARREASLREYAGRVGLSLLAGEYEPEHYEQAVRGQDARPERCRRCYRLRLEGAAREALRQGIGTISTTLLISPYQDQAALHEIGDEVAGRHGLRFHFENLRRGWAERSRLARAYGLYLQQYCGCRFSLAEREATVRRQPASAEERA